MFASRLQLTLREADGDRPVPEAWLDQFFMRNFTGLSAFDETLVAGDGLLEAGFAVDREAVREQFEKWLRGRRLIRPEIRLAVEPVER